MKLLDLIEQLKSVYDTHGNLNTYIDAFRTNDPDDPIPIINILNSVEVVSNEDDDSISCCITAETGKI